MLLITCFPKASLSQASINNNVSVSAYLEIPSWTGLGTINSAVYSMDNFINNEEYKIQYFHNGGSSIANNVKLLVNFSEVGNDTKFTWNTGNSFSISYTLYSGVTPGMLENLKFKIYRKGFLGAWDWQTTFFYDLNTICVTNATFPQGINPWPANDYEVSNTITVSSSVLANAGVAEFDGGSSVTFLPGFSSGLSGNASILGIIDGCGGAYRLSNPLSGSTDFIDQGIASKGEVNIYPNPTSSDLTVDFSKTDFDGEIKLELRDIQGKVVYNSTVFSTSSVLIDLEKFDKGMYFLYINSNNKTSNRKIIKQ